MCRHVHAGVATVVLNRIQPFTQSLGTYTLVLTNSATDPNLVIGTLPPSFDVNSLLPSPSNFTAVFSFAPTTNFTTPLNRFVGIQIQVRSSSFSQGISL